MLGGKITPIKVGILCDYKFGPTLIVKPLFEHAFQYAYKKGYIDRPVQVIAESAYSLPFGEAANLLDGWKKLAEKNCLVIFGPFKSDGAAHLFDYVEHVGHIPTLSVAGGTERFLGEWCFDIGNGNLGEEPYLLVNYMQKLGLHKAAVVVEKSISGKEYFEGYKNAARRAGIQTLLTEEISPLVMPMEGVAKRLKESNAEVVFFFGDGMAGNLAALAKAMKAVDYNPVRMTTTAYLTLVAQKGGLSAIEGWYGIDQYDEENQATKVFLDSIEKTYHCRPANGAVLFFYDAARLIAHAISHADMLTPAAIREGFERVKWLPAVSGSQGAVLNLGKYRHTAWFGTQYLVIRQVVEGKTNPLGALPCKLVHRFAPTYETIGDCNIEIEATEPLSVDVVTN